MRARFGASGWVMAKRAELRKKPSQARSQVMQQSILSAAREVLRTEGAFGFTTNKVASEAGISVGSLYQYYGNKEALLLELQLEEMEATGAQLTQILEKERTDPAIRLKKAIAFFFESEFEERDLRRSLASLRHIFAEDRRFQEMQSAVARSVADFMEKHCSLRGSALADATEVVITLVSSISESVTSMEESSTRIRWWAREVASIVSMRYPIQSN